MESVDWMGFGGLFFEARFRKSTIQIKTSKLVQFAYGKKAFWKTLRQALTLSAASCGEILVKPTCSKGPSPYWWILLLLAAVVLATRLAAEALPPKVPDAAPTAELSGEVQDPSGRTVANASVSVFAFDRRVSLEVMTDQQGHFDVHNIMPGNYLVTAQATGFVVKSVEVVVLAGQPNEVALRFVQISAQNQNVIVVASEPAALTPDPSQRILVHDEVLDASPGRPGAPISIPWLPIETASGGIKAPQYFAPGVAGDHGEPIAQYFQVGDFLYPNNLPANAHGNGYSDPNPLISQGIGAVQVDGGEFNVRDGNHAVNLAASYIPRARVEPFFQLTGDYRDIDLASGRSPSNPETNAWIGIEAAYGN